MIKRAVESKLLKLARKYPVVTITGPRQSGKTTLSQKCFPHYLYCNLEDLDTREFASRDARGFLSQGKKMIIDEVQRVPSLASYVQGMVDKNQKSGQFILTGSHHFEMTNIISQSLAGRTAIVKLLPFSMQELKKSPKVSLDKLLYRGFYPRIVSKKLNPTEALSFYTSTYLERDLRNIKEIKSLSQFESFLKLCASQVGQILNKNRLANDIGIDNKTIDSWLSVLQASFVLFLLPPHFRNFRKRIVKRPKLYFYDVGLASYLLGIKNTNHIKSHPLKGMLFENLVIMEKIKNQLNQVQPLWFYYFRDNTGNEVDLLEESNGHLFSYEIKLSSTPILSMFKGLNFYKKLNANNKKSFLIYTGKDVLMYGHKCISFYNLK